MPLIQCELCRDYTALEVYSFRLHSGKLEPIALESREPYCGVRCICKVCAETIRATVDNRESW